MFGALKGGRFRSLASLILVVNVVGETSTEKNTCGIARFPCGSTAFLLTIQLVKIRPNGRYGVLNVDLSFNLNLLLLSLSLVLQRVGVREGASPSAK